MRFWGRFGHWPHSRPQVSCKLSLTSRLPLALIQFTEKKAHSVFNIGEKFFKLFQLEQTPMTL